MVRRRGDRHRRVGPPELHAHRRQDVVAARTVIGPKRTGHVRFLYQLDNKSNGVNEILAVNDHEFLVIERDGNAGSAAAFKKIFHIDIAAASDIRAVAALPQTGTPDGVTPVSKSPFLDLLDPTFRLAGAPFPEKIEGLAFGPDLTDGRHLLIVTNDNDFVPTQANRFFAFAIDRSDLPQFAPQQFGRRRDCIGHGHDGFGFD